MIRPFDITTEVVEGLSVVRLKGELDATDAPTLSRELISATEFDQSHRHRPLRMRVHRFVGDRCDRRGMAGPGGPESRGHIVLAGSSGQVDRILRITGLYRGITSLTELMRPWRRSSPPMRLFGWQTETAKGYGRVMATPDELIDSMDDRRLRKAGQGAPAALPTFSTERVQPGLSAGRYRRSKVARHLDAARPAGGRRRPSLNCVGGPAGG